MQNIRHRSVSVAAMVIGFFVVSGPVAHAEPTLDTSSVENFAASSTSMMEFIQGHQDITAADKLEVTQYLIGHLGIVAEAELEAATSDNETPAQIKAKALGKLDHLSGLSFEGLLELAKTSNARARATTEAERQATEARIEAEKQAAEAQGAKEAEAQAAALKQEIHAILDDLRSKSSWPGADYVDIPHQSGFVRFQYAPDKSDDGSILLLGLGGGMIISQPPETYLTIFPKVPLDKEFLNSLKRRTLDEELVGGTTYFIEGLRAIAGFEKQFKEWEKIAEEDPPPPFLMLADGRRLQDEQEGFYAAYAAFKESGRKGEDKLHIPAFRWTGGEAKLVVFSSNNENIPERNSEFFGEANQILLIADDLVQVTRSSVERVEREKQAREKLIDERFKVASVGSTSLTQSASNSASTPQSTSASRPSESSTTPLASTVKYRAKLSATDLRNSKGVFLPDIPNIQARDILLQDRFNYHQKGMRDPEDTNEGLYEEGKDSMRRLFEGKEARLADGGDLMALLASEPVVDVALTENEIIVTPVE